VCEWRWRLKRSKGASCLGFVIRRFGFRIVDDHELLHSGGGLVGKALIGEFGRVEGVGAMVQHLLRIVVGDGGGLDAEVAEHGIGFPAAKKLDGVTVDSGTEEGGGTAWSKGASTDEGWFDSRGGFNFFGGVTEGVGDEFGLDFIPLLAATVVMAVDRVGWLSFVLFEMKCDAAQSFGGAQ